MQLTCLAEKLATHVVAADRITTLNKRSEMVSKCRYENKILSLCLVVVVVVVVFIILLGESQQTGLLLGTLGGFLYYGQRERAMLLDDSRMEAHSTDLLPEKK